MRAAANLALRSEVGHVIRLGFRADPHHQAHQQESDDDQMHTGIGDPAQKDLHGSSPSDDPGGVRDPMRSWLLLLGSFLEQLSYLPFVRLPFHMVTLDHERRPIHPTMKKGPL